MNDQNIEMLRQAVQQLGELSDELVFVGGCATAMFITDAGAAEVRPTKDVDAIVGATNYAEYLSFSERLKMKGFSPDTRPEAPLCRWVIEDLVVDIMPLDEKILGFSNVWYRDAIRNSELRALPGGSEIRIVTPPFFLATKLAAFQARGEHDFLASHDLEDVITVIDGRSEIETEVKNAPRHVRDYIAKVAEKFLEDREFLDALPGHLLPDSASQARLQILIERLRAIASFNKLEE